MRHLHAINYCVLKDTVLLLLKKKGGKFQFGRRIKLSKNFPPFTSEIILSGMQVSIPDNMIKSLNTVLSGLR